MTEKPYNPDDPQFLFSQSLDEKLSESQRRQLEKGMAESASVSADAEKLRAVDDLVKRWGRDECVVEGERLVESVLANIAASAERENVDELDHLLERWGNQNIEIDWPRFTEEVMSKVTSARRRSSTHRLVFRLAAPLAAAAVLAFAVTATLWLSSTSGPVTVVRIGPRSSTHLASAATSRLARVTVVFGRAAIVPDVRQPVGARISYVSVGSSRVFAGSEEIPPL